MNVRVKASGQVGSLVAEVDKRCFIRFGDSSSQVIIEYGRKEIQKSQKIKKRRIFKWSI